MNRITHLNQLIESELDEFRLVLLEEKEYQIKPYVDELAKKASGYNKGELARFESFKLFLIYFYLTNNNILSFDEAYNMALEVRDSVNGWTYVSDGTTLMDLVKCLNRDGSVLDNKAFEYMTRLKLTPDFVNYDMRNVYLIMFSFLKLKKDINEINFKNGNLQNRARLLKQVYNNSQMKNFVEIAVNSLQESDSKIDYRHEVAKEKIKYTKEVQQKVEDLSILQIDEMPDDWHRYLELELLEELYNIIFDNLRKKETELQGQIKDKERIINKTPLTSYLYSYGIDINSINPVLIEALEQKVLKDDIVSILDFLRGLGISLNSIFVQYSNLLLYLTEEKINKIRFLISSNVISKKTLLNNLDGFDKKYDEILTNYEILKPIIDFNSIFYDDNILLESTHTLKNILSILANYDLTKNNYIFLLCHFSYLYVYDLLLENEIPLYLFISICETKNPLNTIKRILIYREIGEDFETGGKLLRKDLRSEEKCLISDNELDEYFAFVPVLFNINGNKIGNVLKNEVVKNMDEHYLVSHDLYRIGGTLFSRPKFLRNFEAKKEDNESVIACLISNSLLTDSEYLKIIKELKGKRL